MSYWEQCTQDDDDDCLWRADQTEESMPRTISYPTGNLCLLMRLLLIQAGSPAYTMQPSRNRTNACRRLAGKRQTSTAFSNWTCTHSKLQKLSTALQLPEKGSRTVLIARKLLTLALFLQCAKDLARPRVQPSNRYSPRWSGCSVSCPRVVGIPPWAAE